MARMNTVGVVQSGLIARSPEGGEVIVDRDIAR